MAESESFLSHWLFLYGTMLVYIAIGVAGLWFSSRPQPRADKDRRRRTGSV
ncbi:hypothetical protein BH23ACI1_BH23ACI1_00530 [soil metagenome]